MLVLNKFSTLARARLPSVAARASTRARFATSTLRTLNPTPTSNNNFLYTLTVRPIRYCSISSNFLRKNYSSMAGRDTLPKSVKPQHYELSLYDLELGGNFSYQGRVKINLEITESTQEIVLNTNQLKIHDATFSGKDSGEVNASNISYNEKQHRATMSFPSSLEKTSNGILDISFQGTMNNDMAGFYRSKYKPEVTPAASVAKDAEYHYMFSTQFEACNARTAFPCFDEPNLKASFDVEIEIPDDQTAISNMPEKNTKKSAKQGLKVVSFEKTPIMSTYLLAWAFGDFEYVEAFTDREYSGKKLPVRVYTTRGLKEQGRYALDHAPKILDYFSEIFGIDYPLPKSDLLAVHEFSHGAMENWGLVTYRTTAVLFDEEKSDDRYRKVVAYVVAHELAHQWFGNLVTMDWWNELWLNEGFATWVGWLATDKLHPEWNVWGQFVNEGYQVAFDLDSLRTSHPIEVPVRDALEVEQVFDAISYQKGSSVIRMLSGYLGEKVFLEGVSQYLKAHSYANATTNDLWSAVSKASGQNINAFMDPWILKIGLPVVTVAEEPDQISLKQSRFLLSGDVKPEEDETTWWIPIGLKTESKSADSKALTNKSDTIRNVSTDFYKINEDQTGFYRTNYPPERLTTLGTQKDKLSVQDKVGLIGDAGALAFSGHGTSSALLGLLEGFKDETNSLVWSQIVSALANVRSVFASNEAVSESLRRFTLKLVTPEAEKVGWEYAPGEDWLTGQKRALLLATAGLAGHEGIILEANKRFELFVSGKDRKAIHPSLRSAVWRIAIKSQGKPAYDAIKQEYLTTTSVDGKEIALTSMGRVEQQDLGKDFFNFLLSDSVAVQDIHSGATALAANSKTRLLLWHSIRDSWASLDAKIAGNSVVVDRFLRLSLKKFSERDVAEDIAQFFKDKDTKGYERSLNIVQETIAGNAQYKERDEARLTEWLKTRGY